MFNITNYLSMLEGVVIHSSWIEATCPVCQGKLKISTSGARLGAYSCYTNNCQSLPGNPIRQIVTKYDIKLPSTKTSLCSKYVKLTKLVQPLHLRKIDERIFSNETYIDDIKVSKLYDGSVERVYCYDEFDLYRIELPNGKKTFYPRQLIDGVYVNKVPDPVKIIPLYKSKYISEFVVMAEGEKSADVLHRLGVNGLSFPGFAYSDVCLPKYMRALSKIVKSIVYLEDNDLPGAKKRDLVLQAAWGAGIEASSYNLGHILHTDTRGYDIADAVEEKKIETRENLLHVLWDTFTNSDNASGE